LIDVNGCTGKPVYPGLRLASLDPTLFLVRCENSIEGNPMSKQEQSPFTLPQGFATIPGLSKESLESLSGAFSDWMRNSSQIQAELIRFVGDRFSKDVAMISRFASCKKPEEFVAVQSELITGLTNDYLQQGAKLFALSSEVAKESIGKFAKVAGSARG
jgi:hypothetical protein